MRQFDNWNVYFVQGKPFFGRFTFYKLHTTEKVEITDEEGTPLDNPILSDTYGRTSQQVFLPDEDVTVKLETYIGNGDMNDSMGHDIDNISAWAEAYTFDSLKNSLVLDISEGAVVGTLFATMNDLRLADYEHCNYALLTGYYEAGDMPPQFYVLQEDVTTPDNGGSVVRINSRYIWRMVPKESIDVRSFGVFPSDSINNLRETFQSQWQHCFNYANTMGLNVYAPKVYDSDSYYQVVGGNFNLNQIMHVDSGAHIVAKPNTTTTFNLKEIEYFGNELFLSNTTTPITTGMITVNVNTARTSWKSHSWANWPGTVSNFIVDTLDTSFSFTNARVEFEKTIENKVLSFTNCEITSNKRMKNCTASFTNCGYISDLWLDGTYTIGSLSGNIIELSEMSSANVYVNWKNKQNEANYGDLGEQTLSNVTLMGGAVAENAYFTNVTLAGNAELHNISGTVSIATSSNQNWIDCWLTLSGNPTISSLQFRRGELGGSGTLRLVSFSTIDGVAIRMPINAMGAVTTIKNSDISASSTITGNALSIHNNQISAIIDQSDFAGTISVSCIGNMFYGSGQHYIHASTPNSKVVGIWTRNGSAYDDKHWIKLDRTNLKEQDNDHEYTYADNAEPYLMKYNGRNHPMRFPIYVGSYSEGRGIFSTTSTPFAFINKRTKEVYVVPRSIKWKAFSVGKGFLARSFAIRCDWSQGIFEDSYEEHTNGHITIIYTWGAETYSNSQIMGGQKFSYSNCISRDGSGLANFDVSFESANYDHSTYNKSYGVRIGIINRDPYDGWSHFAVYPATPMSSLELCVYPDNNFKAGSTTPEGY